ncbi:MAG: sensor histidine kinase [Rhodanobacter sp.]
MKIGQAMRWRTAGLLLAVLVIVGLPYIVTLASLRSASQAAAWIAHSKEAKSIAYQLAYVIRDSEAASYRLLAGDSDESTRKRAGRAAREVPGLLQQLHTMTFDNPDQQMRVGALESSANGRVTLMNQALARLQQANLAGARQSLRDAGDLFKIGDSIAAIVQNEENLLQARQADAARQSFHDRIVLSITALAQLLLLTIIVGVSERQISQRLLAEVREHQAVHRSRLILQAVREPIGLFDENLNSLLVNTAFSELYGIDPEQGPQALVQIGEQAWSDSALLQRLNDVLLRDRELWDYETTQRTVDGVERHVVISARRLQQKDADAPTQLLLTVSDVTARALAEQKVNELNRQLEGKVVLISDVNRELEAFSYSVSHDLRAPLRHIGGFARKLEQHLGDRVDDKAHHYIEVITDSAKHMALLIDDLLVFSQLGRGPLRLQAVDMQSVAEEARAMAESSVPGRRIVWTLAPLPMVIGDENMLRTVWQNLLDNAVKYTGQCDVARIGVSVQQGRNGDYEFTVADNGAGFDMQYADKLFGVFQRLHRASEFPGNGIGLANVRRIIARHGGRVWAEAEPGQGARFHFSLPATDAAGAHT